MTEPDLVDRLAAHRALGAVPREELEWLAAHGTVHHAAAGDLVSPKGVPVERMIVVLAGTIAIFVERAGGRHKAMEWRAGDLTGLLPYSRLVRPPGDSLVQEAATYLAVHRDHFPALIRECHELPTLLVHTMLDRARWFTSNELHDEKMISLGKLSAGLAHELNNPAAAIERNASLLQARLDAAERAVRDLGGSGMTAGQLAALDTLRESCQGTAATGVRSPIEQAEREEAIADWLEARGVDIIGAEALAETTVTVEALDRVAAAIDGPALEAVLRWAAAGCAVRSLAAEIQEASMRISGLVLAIKGFTHMDQAAVAEPVDLGRSLANTVAVLRAKAQAKSSSVVVDAEPGLPRVRGFAGELNQIWANLIDNALDAIPAGGKVEVTARRERDHVVVRVADDGPGIPETIRARIFEPFFTTKAMGQGTGLGLDIVRRLVRHNDADIEVESRPGRTEFRVTLPIAGDTP